jgi:sialic acid synthase SpsE
MKNKFIDLIKLRDAFNPYIIAEIGVNHEGSIKKAKNMIDLASKEGADCVKFQTYKAELLASKNSPSYWDLKKEKTKSQYLLFKKYDKFNKNDYINLAHYCKKKSIDFLSTPFDDDSVEFLDPYLKFYKVASADLTNFPLLKKISSKKKPVILSVGASTLQEINKTIKFLNKNGIKDIILLHCILNYPTLNKNANLDKINLLKKKYQGKIVGYSDHTVPDSIMSSLLIATFYGAKIIEKHFTFDKNLKGNDHYHSMDTGDLKNFKNILNQFKILNGTDNYNPLELEKKARLNARRSLVLKINLEKGQKLKNEHLISKRPGFGICPSNIQDVLGKKINKNLKEDHILKYKDISN